MQLLISIAMAQHFRDDDCGGYSESQLLKITWLAYSLQSYIEVEQEEHELLYIQEDILYTLVKIIKVIDDMELKCH